jgi:hypothetical protein
MSPAADRHASAWNLYELQALQLQYCLPAQPQHREANMCDYSLHLVASRPAKVGDRLVTTKFANTTTRGFAAFDAPDVAVCLLPGTEIAFEREAEHDHALRRILPGLRFGKIGARLALFCQVDTTRTHVHHDALEFSNGRFELITRLCEGQRATVLQLPASAPAASDHEWQKAPVSAPDLVTP